MDNFNGKGKQMNYKNKQNLSKKNSYKKKTQKHNNFNKQSKIVSVIIIALVFLIPTLKSLFNNKTAISKLGRNNLEKAQVVKHVDGDTVHVKFEDGRIEKLRFIGVDAPELANEYREAEFYAEEASKYLRDLIYEKTIYLEKDVSDRDQYNRLLRYVWLESALDNVDFDNITKADLANHMVNAKLLVEGYAKLVTFPPDVKYHNFLREFNKEARKNSLGLWRKSN